jgi:serine/threonine protein kinase
MGVVYLAKNVLMDRLEVLKVVNKSLINTAGASERFLREIRSAAQLGHNNVVKAHSALTLGDLLVLAMEYIEGDDLAKVVRQEGPLSIPRACYYTYQAALGLQHAHEHRMVHRDIKPHNMILSRQGKKHTVKILDFGLAKATREGKTDSGLTGPGMVMGTPDYIAPEQAMDAANADIRADIYSLGCTLYFMLTGVPPFQGRSLVEILQGHLTQQAQPVNQARADVPPELAAIVARMMAKDPAQRYQQPLEVAQALAPFVKTGSTTALGGPGPTGGGRAEIATQVDESRPTETAAAWKEIASESSSRGSSDSKTAPSKTASSRTARLSLAPRPATKRWLIIAGIPVCLLALGLVGMWAGGLFTSKEPGGGNPDPDPQAEAAKRNADAEGFVPLFNGKDLEDWLPESGEAVQWKVEDGAIVARRHDSQPWSALLSKRDYANFVMRFEFRAAEAPSFSAVVYRAEVGETERVNDQPRPMHPNIDLARINAQAPKPPGHLWWRSGRPLPPNRKVDLKVAKEWNEVEVQLRNSELTMLVNGVEATHTDLDGVTQIPDAIPGYKRSSGRIGFQVMDGTIQYRNVRIKELSPGPSDQGNGPSRQVKRFPARLPNVGNGKWCVAGDYLMQPTIDKDVSILFGDRDWTDYDFSVEAQWITGNGDLSLFFRNRDFARNMYNYGLGTFINKAITLEAWAAGKSSIPINQAHPNGLLRTGEWFTARVEVRGTQVKCFLNGRQVIVNNAIRQPAGGVGLRTWQSAYVFRNIKVTSPDGKVLLEGLPDVGSAGK